MLSMRKLLDAYWAAEQACAGRPHDEEARRARDEIIQDLAGSTACPVSVNDSIIGNSSI